MIVKHKSSGFALMVSLGLMSFVFLLVLGFATLIQVNSKLSSSGENYEQNKRTFCSEFSNWRFAK